METKVFAAILVLLSTTYTAGRDVKQFVGMPQKIWTAKTTNRAHMRCLVDQRISIGPMSVLFDRSFLTRSHRSDRRIRGVFDTRHKKRMTIFYGDTFVSTETMIFMDPDRSCAVFKVESLVDWDVSYYDLRVTNSSITTRPRPSCPQYFSRIAGYQPSFTVYTPECQQIM